MHFSTLTTLFLSASLAFAAPTPTWPTPTLEERQDPAAIACKPVGIKNPQRVVNAFKSSGVVPTLIPKIAPKVKVRVKYDKPVKLGNSFTTAETTNQPSYSFSAEQGRNPRTTTYSFFMVDPDVPNPQSPARMPYLHWYVSGNNPSCINNQSPNTVTAYEAPSPLSTQQHRYTFLVYREPPGYVPDAAGAQTRPGFDVNAYAAAGGLVLVGGNFFLEAVTNT